MARRKKWLQRSLWCWVGKHQWVPDDGIRLLVLNDSWPAEYTDGLPGGKKFVCPGCGTAMVRPYSARTT